MYNCVSKLLGYSAGHYIYFVISRLFHFRFVPVRWLTSTVYYAMVNNYVINYKKWREGGMKPQINNETERKTGGGVLLGHERIVRTVYCCSLYTCYRVTVRLVRGDRSKPDHGSFRSFWCRAMQAIIVLHQLTGYARWTRSRWTIRVVNITAYDIMPSTTEADNVIEGPPFGCEETSHPI